MKYSEYPRNEKPENRIRDLGGPSLSTAELFSVALFINDTDMANSLSAEYTQVGGLSKMRPDKVKKIKGVGEGYASAILAISELVRREALNTSPERPVVTSPAIVADLVMYEMSKLEVEQLRVVLLDTRHRVIKIITLYQGTVNSSNVRVAEVFRDAIRENATSIIVIHNHPTGDPSPSPEDICVTRSIQNTGKLMDIMLLDHLIIGGGRFVSLKERRLGF
jgi:DNA repair protein RadC